MANKPYFFNYQKNWINDPSRFKICEKSRRVGITYAESYAVTRNAASGKVDKTWFTSADLSAAEEFVDYLEFWAKLLNTAAKNVGEVVIDKEQDVTARRVVYASGAQVNAISSNPSAFRSKGGVPKKYMQQLNPLFNGAIQSGLFQLIMVKSHISITILLKRF